jgi:glutamyl-tRNA synthetase
VKIKIKGGKKKKLREMEAGDEMWISSSDAESLEIGETIRLKDLYNVKIEKKGKEISASYAGDEIQKGKKIQWVSDGLQCEVLRPGDLLTASGEYNPSSMGIDTGLCEKSVHSLKEGEMVQFERYGFCRLDSKKPLRFVFSC